MFSQFAKPTVSFTDLLAALPPPGKTILGPRLAGDIAIAKGLNPLALDEEDVFQAVVIMKHGRSTTVRKQERATTVVGRPHFVFARC